MKITDKDVIELIKERYPHWGYFNNYSYEDIPHLESSGGVLFIVIGPGKLAEHILFYRYREVPVPLPGIGTINGSFDEPTISFIFVDVGWIQKDIKKCDVCGEDALVQIYHLDRYNYKFPEKTPLCPIHQLLI